MNKYNNEEWKDINGYEGLYQISNLGRVKTLRDRHGNKRLMKTSACKHHGYVNISLYNKTSKTYRLHRVVAKHFIPNPKNLPQVNHIDGDKTNNSVDNLEWCTASQNMLHSFKIGTHNATGENCGYSRLKNKDVKDIKKLLEKGLSTRKIAKLFQVCQGTIASIKTGRTWSHI